MKNLLLLLTVIIMTMVSCTGPHLEAPEIPRFSRTIVETTETVEVPDFLGTYISTTHNPTDLIEFFPGGSFYYQADCNNQARVNDFSTWRIGRYAGAAEAMTLTYEDGGTAIATANEGSIVYLEGNIQKIFIPSAEVNFEITKNPNFTDEII